MNQALKSLVDEIFQLTEKYNKVLGVHEVQTMNAPATPAEIDALEAHLGTKLPPSYRDLLEICNGWTGFFSDMDLLSVQQQMEGEYARYVHQWKGEQWAEGEPVPVEAIVFAIALNTNHALLFDTNTVKKNGEMKAVWWDDGELTRYDGLVKLLEAQRDRLKRLIRRKR
ncbi:SMI1/KNR4 family protein [Variovorax robiniae]|uniref:SMI1/KNR4 family protein n=1 Tax=Variovorax robiniae TaxID=1836199 RepID=A0ABU8XDI4_9BURK